MKTANRIIAANVNANSNYTGTVAIEASIRELAVKCEGGNCFDRVWTFYDGSRIAKTRDGYSAI